MTEKGLVAGTIMVTNQQGESFFLVQPHDQKITFLFEKMASGSKSPMGTAMDILVRQVTVSPESFRLMDLTNLKQGWGNGPLFVFDLVERPENPDSLLRDTGNACWRRAKDLDHLWDECDFEGVPIYHD